MYLFRITEVIWLFSGYGKFGNVRENLQLSKHHFTPFMLYKDSAVDDMIRGLASQSSQKFDRFFSNEVGFNWVVCHCHQFRFLQLDLSWFLCVIFVKTDKKTLWLIPEPHIISMVNLWRQGATSIPEILAGQTTMCFYRSK